MDESKYTTIVVLEPLWDKIPYPVPRGLQYRTPSHEAYWGHVKLS